MYRIIGIFKDTNNEYQVKLIKATAGQATVNGATMLGTSGSYKTENTYYWNSSNNNTWSSSVLNKTNLNISYIAYLNAINSKWFNMIENHAWSVGGQSQQYVISAGPSNVYGYEMPGSYSSTYYSDEIGLMYVSDYMYGASPSYWNLTAGYYNSAISSNWLALGNAEWTITPDTYYSFKAYSIKSEGYIRSESTNNDFIVRPTFYLKSDIIYYDGSGTSSDPYRITLSE